MAEFETTTLAGSGLPAGVTPLLYRSAAGRLVAAAGLCFVTGAADARTFIEAPGDASNGMDVDVTRAPADPFGLNADAAVAAGATGSMQAKFRLMTTLLDAIATSLNLLDNTVTSNRLQVDIVSGGLTITRPATSAVTTQATTQTVATLKASNTNRLGLIIYNESASVLYVKLGSGATTADWTYKVDPDSGIPPDWFAGYTGIVTGIHATGLTGTAHVTELTA